MTNMTTLDSNIAAPVRKNIDWLGYILPTVKGQLGLYARLQIVPTLRSMFYKLISLNILQNISTRYDYLSRVTARAREEGYLPMNCFADNSRRIIDIDDYHESIEDYIGRGVNHINNAVIGYKIPRWYRQLHYVEVWVEKDAMTGTLDSIINVAGKRDVRIVPTKGQESVTFAWENAQRLKEKQDEGKQIHIRYFGDLDPSGEQIEQSIREKLTLEPYGLNSIDFKRVAVTNEQRIEFNLIPNTDRDTISKLKRDKNRWAFIKKYNLESENDLFQIEVDALQAIVPNQFKTMVLNCIDEFFDEEIYEQNRRPTTNQINQVAQSQVWDLYASLQSQLEYATP